MSNNPDHWNSLISDLGVQPPPPTEETRQTKPAAPPPRPRPAAPKPAAAPKLTDWSHLANQLGVAAEDPLAQAELFETEARQAEPPGAAEAPPPPRRSSFSEPAWPREARPREAAPSESLRPEPGAAAAPREETFEEMAREEYFEEVAGEEEEVASAEGEAGAEPRCAAKKSEGIAAVVVVAAAAARGAIANAPTRARAREGARRSWMKPSRTMTSCWAKSPTRAAWSASPPSPARSDPARADRGGGAAADRAGPTRSARPPPKPVPSAPPRRRDR